MIAVYHDPARGQGVIMCPSAVYVFANVRNCEKSGKIVEKSVDNYDKSWNYDEVIR